MASFIPRRYILPIIGPCRFFQILVWKKSPPLVIKLQKRNVEILIKGEICLPVLDGYLLSADTWAHAEPHLQLAHTGAADWTQKKARLD